VSAAPDTVVGMDLRDQHRRAIKSVGDVVALVGPDQLDLPTPCTDWTLGQLLAHVIGQNHGFAASADGETADLSIWRDRPVDGEPAQAYDESAERIITAFAAEGLLAREFWLPEIRTGGTFPAELAISFQLVDTVAHGWDIARSVGADVEFDADVLAAGLGVAQKVPDGENRAAPGAAFRPSVPAGGATSTLAEIVALLGRSPDWVPPRVA
jgi:uncharacterized protein (TIGR03086 family)